MKQVFLMMFATLVMSLSSTLPAKAQTTWRSLPASDARWQGGAVCTPKDAQTGNIFCLSLACRPNEKLQYVLSFVGGDLPAKLRAKLAVDGREVAQIALSRSNYSGFAEYTSGPETAPNAMAIKALKAGRGVSLLLTHDSGVRLHRDFGLKGSSAVLARAVKHCGFAPPPPPPPIADPQAAAVESLTKPCADMGGQVVVEPGIVTDIDLDADGLPDRVVDFHGIYCDKMRSYLCGSAGCPVAFYRQQPEGGYVRLSGGHLRGYTLKTKPVLTLHLHGSACGKIGAAECNKSYTVEGNRIVPLK